MLKGRYGFWWKLIGWLIVAPPMAYVLAIWVEEAKQLLETGALSVEDIGRAVGYEDPASFGRLFKTRTGLTLSGRTGPIIDGGNIERLQPMLVRYQPLG
jgi:AraC-like DNA-binding protein